MSAPTVDRELVLDELRELLDQHTARADVVDLLDEVTRIVRRARAAVRRAAKAALPAKVDEQAGKPAPSTTPAVPVVRPPTEAARPTASPASARPGTVTATVDRPLGVRATPKPQAPTPTAAAVDVFAPHRRWRQLAERALPWLPLLVLAVVVAIAIAIGVGEIGAAALVAGHRSVGRMRCRAMSHDRPPGRT